MLKNFVKKLKNNDVVRAITKYVYTMGKMVAIGYTIGTVVGKIVAKVCKTDKSRAIGGIVGIGAMIPMSVAIAHKETKLLELDYDDYLDNKDSEDEEEN